MTGSARPPLVAVKIALAIFTGGGGEKIKLNGRTKSDSALTVEVTLKLHLLVESAPE